MKKRKEKIKKIPSIEKLIEIARPKRKSWLWRDKFVRSVSIHITRLFLFTNISANGVTWIMLFTGILSAMFYTKGVYVFSLIGLLLHHLYFILDAVDGEVARYTKKTSDKGVYLDLMSHIIVHPLLIMGMAIGAFYNNPLPIPDYYFLFFGFVGSFSYMVSNFASDKKYELFVKKGDFKTLEKMKKRITYDDDTKINHFKEELWFLISFEVINLMFFFTILNLIPYLVIIYAILFSYNAVRKFSLGYKHVDRLIAYDD